MIKWTGVAVVVRTTRGVAVTLLTDIGRTADERRLPATFGVLADIERLKQAGFGDTKMLVHAGAKTLSARGISGSSPKRNRLREEHRQVLANSNPNDAET